MKKQVKKPPKVDDDDSKSKKKEDKKKAKDEFESIIPQLQIALSRNLEEALLAEFGNTPGSCLYSLQASEVAVQVYLDLTTRTYASTQAYCRGQEGQGQGLI